MAENTITLYFNWNSVTPDPREYQQQRETLSPVRQKRDKDDFLVPLSVAVEIPLTGENVYNAADILTAQVSSDLDVPEPILTPKGMFEAIRLLEQPFSEAEEKEQYEWAEEGEEQSKGKQKLDWDEDETGSDPWKEEESEPTVDPLPEDSPQPTEEDEWESKPNDFEEENTDTWEEAISTDDKNTLNDETDNDIPDWEDESTWSDEKGDE